MDPEKDSEPAKNVEATSTDLSEATINKMKGKDLKGGLNSRRLLQIGRRAELQDRLIYAIKDKVPINGVVDNTKDKDFVFYCIYQSILQFRFPSNL